MRPTVTLAPHQQEFYDHNGFLTLDQITTPDELAWLRTTYDRLFADRVGWEDGRNFDLAGTDDGEAALPQILQPSRYAPDLNDTLYLTNARALAEQLLGEPLAEGINEHMIFKPARTGPATPWHQDQAYADPTKRYRSVNFWLPLDDATIDSGCLQFVPGSWRTDVVDHHSIGHDPRVHGLEIDDPERHARYAVACPVPAGGCAIHAAYTMHYAGPNTSDRPRRAYILAFQTVPTDREQPIDNHWERRKQTARLERQAAARAAGR